ncbi:MAG: methylglyoxal synthase [Candidatus Promineifilaceae bacterium]
MEETTWSIGSKKRIALIAHDHKKKDLLEWAKFNRDALAQHIVIGTGTTGRLLEQTLEMEVVKLQSGPLGGDQQIGARISEGDIDFVIFFWDPLESMPHDVDVKALLRLAVLWNIPIACNRASADFMFSSRLMNEPYERILPDYEAYRERVIADVNQIESQPALPILPAEDGSESDAGGD